MDTKGKNVIKIICYIIFCCILLLCLCSDIFYLIIRFCCPKKDVSYTYNVNTLKNVEDESDKYVVSVRYYGNKDNSGIELFEVKFNYYMNSEAINEKNADIYESGLQIVGYGPTLISHTNVCYKTDEPWFQNETSYYKTKFNSNEYYYNSQNGISFSATSEIDEDTFFKVSIGDRLFGMKFKGEQTEYAFETYPVDWFKLVYNKCYMNYDISYFSALLLNAARSLPSSTDGAVTFEFKDLFNYYEYKNGAFISKQVNSTALSGDTVIDNITNYYTIKIQTFETGAISSADSLFGLIENKPDFSINGGVSTDDYMYGYHELLLNENDFDYVHCSDGINTYKMKLKESTIDYLNSSDDYYIVINIDLSILKENDINAVGFDDNSGLADFCNKIKSIIIHSDEKDWEVCYDATSFY